MKCLIVCLLSYVTLSANAQQADTLRTDTNRIKKIKEVIVTATRTAKELMLFPMPVTTISNKRLKTGAW